MNIPLNCPHCGQENNVNSEKLKIITPVTCKKCNKSFKANFTEKDLKRFKNLSNPIENIMGDIRVSF